MPTFSLAVYDSSESRVFETYEELLVSVDIHLYQTAFIDEEAGLVAGGPFTDDEVAKIVSRLLSLGQQWLALNPDEDSYHSLYIENGVYWGVGDDPGTVEFFIGP